MAENIYSIEWQARTRAEHERERFDFVFGKEPKLLSGKGKYYLLNFVGLKAAYDEAVQKCPLAADAILVLVWNACQNYQALEFLAKDFESRDAGGDLEVSDEQG